MPVRRNAIPVLLLVRRNAIPSLPVIPVRRNAIPSYVPCQKKAILEEYPNDFQEDRMSDVTDSAVSHDCTDTHPGDALGASVVILLSINVIQRSIGFVRSVFFCRLLSPAELGRWDLVFNFILLAAPLVSLAIPAAFGRYAEYYRNRRQLRTMIRRTAVVGTGTGVPGERRALPLPCGVLDADLRNWDGRRC